MCIQSPRTGLRTCYAILAYTLVHLSTVLRARRGEITDESISLSPDVGSIVAQFVSAEGERAGPLTGPLLDALQRL